MARRPRKSAQGTQPERGAQPPAPGGPDATRLTPGVLVTFRREARNEMRGAVARLQSSAGVRSVAFTSEFAARAVDPEQARQAGMVVFDNLGVAVMDVDPDQATRMSAMPRDAAIAAMEPEPIFFAFGDGSPADHAAYLRGYKDAVDHLHGKLASGGQAAAVQEAFAAAQASEDTAEASWGLIATGAVHSRSSGRGIRVAVLDTGLDLDHPDFRGRQIVSQSFVAGATVDDDNGHGTHCAGTACGPRNPARGRRYGIAHEAEIYIGKVLPERGSNLGRATLAGIEWAVANGCHIVSLSLGGSILPGQEHLTAFEEAAREALRRNTLIIAAAGNDSRRSQNKVLPVAAPANCPSIMAVGALDRLLRTADFSNGSINADGHVDIAGPGVDVYSSAPEPPAMPQPPFFRLWSAQYDTISGTSQAAPHVAGIAALLREENPTLNASEIWRLLTARARTLPQPAGDVGSGLVQA